MKRKTKPLVTTNELVKETNGDVPETETQHDAKRRKVSR